MSYVKLGEGGVESQKCYRRPRILPSGALNQGRVVLGCPASYPCRMMMLGGKAKGGIGRPRRTPNVACSKKGLEGCSWIFSCAAA